MTRQNPNRGRIVAGAVIAIGLAGTIIDPNGVVGVMLFGAAAAALLYLVAPTRRPSGRGASGARPAGSRRDASGCSSARERSSRSPWPPARCSARPTSSTRTATPRSSRILNDATFLGGFVLVAAIALVILGTAVRWTRSAYSA